MSTLHIDVLISKLRAAVVRLSIFSRYVLARISKFFLHYRGICNACDVSRYNSHVNEYHSFAQAAESIYSSADFSHNMQKVLFHCKCCANTATLFGDFKLNNYS